MKKDNNIKHINKKVSNAILDEENKDTNADKISANTSSKEDFVFSQIKKEQIAQLSASFKEQKLNEKIQKVCCDSKYPKEKETFLRIFEGKVKDWDNATDYLANLCIKKFHPKRKISDKISEMFVYCDKVGDENEGLYISDGKCRIKEYINDVLEEYDSIIFSNRIMHKVENKTYIEQDKFNILSNFYKGELILKNGIYNLATGKLKPFTPKKIFFRKVNASFNKKAICPKICAFVKDIVEPKYVDLVWEIIGYCFLKDCRFHKTFMFLGSGANGKGVLLALIKHLLGTDNVSELTLSEFTTNSFQIYGLFGRMLNLGSDAGSKPLAESELFLKAVAGEGIEAHVKNNPNTLKFDNTCKLIFAANKLPKIPVILSTDGFWRRWVFFKFLNKYVSQNEINAEKDVKLKARLKLINPNLLKELVADETELNGMFNMAIKGYNRLINNNKFSYSDTNNEIKDTWNKEANTFIAFAEDNLYFGDEDNKIAIKELTRNYSIYCLSNRVTPSTREDITLFMNANGASYGQTRIYTSEGVSRITVWEGVRFVKKEIVKEELKKQSVLDFDKKNKKE